MKIVAFLKVVWAVFLSLFLSLSPAGFPQVPHPPIGWNYCTKRIILINRSFKAYMPTPTN